MDITPVSMDQHHVFTEINSKVKSIKRKVQSLLERLCMLEPRDTIFGDDALSISIVPHTDNTRELAQVDSILGSGRFTLFWTKDMNGLVAGLRFECQRFDSYDQPFWQPSFEIFVPATGGSFVTIKDEKIYIPLDSGVGASRLSGIFEVQLAIFAAFTQS